MAAPENRVEYQGKLMSLSRAAVLAMGGALRQQVGLITGVTKANRLLRCEMAKRVDGSMSNPVKKFLGF